MVSIEARDDQLSDVPASAFGGVPFSIAVRQSDAQVVVAASGDIDLATVDRVNAALGDASGRLLVLDLREVTFLDTSGLRLVLDHHRRACRGGRRFALLSGPPQVQRLFDIAGITDHLDFLNGLDPSDGDGLTA